MTLHDIVVKNGLVVSAQATVYADVGIVGERIVEVGTKLDGARVIDASNCLVIPGGVDPHVHLQMPLAGLISTDTFETGTIAAICGGTTTVIDFVTPESGESMSAALGHRQREADGAVAADYGLHMTIPTWHAANEERLAEVPNIVGLGCATFKMYQAYDGMELGDEALLRAMRAVSIAGGGVVLHSEVGPIIDLLRREALCEGHTDAVWHAQTRPAQLEASAVHRAMALAEIAGVRLHIFHVGADVVVETIRKAQAAGLQVSAETCPQYLLLTAEKQLSGVEGNLCICAPPLRCEADQNALWEALQDGTLDVVSTDHCPWTRVEKDQPDFASVPGGVPSIEARLSLIHHFGVNQGELSLERWVEICCTAPARLMGLQSKGKIAPGYDADVVVFDPLQRKRLTVDSLHEAADWTPYDGLEVSGWPRIVLLRGSIAVEDGVFLGNAQGRFIRRTLA